MECVETRTGTSRSAEESQSWGNWYKYVCRGILELSFATEGFVLLTVKSCYSGILLLMCGSRCRRASPVREPTATATRYLRVAVDVGGRRQ